MNYLLDTHSLIWFINVDKQLSKKALILIEDTNNKKFVSICSLLASLPPLPFRLAGLSSPNKDRDRLPAGAPALRIAAMAEQGLHASGRQFYYASLHEAFTVANVGTFGYLSVTTYQGTMNPTTAYMCRY